ncbi:unnamed protein product [Moneuplotes crassus]|uniref:Uncharacterized protein n=1 Tax=Euplotes crassus TaxID=5936 RepID=A0AAD1U6G1_EUPCR|nr:unnamed protein product [Moneuplotes crassus]
MIESTIFSNSVIIKNATFRLSNQVIFLRLDYIYKVTSFQHFLTDYTTENLMLAEPCAIRLWNVASGNYKIKLTNLEASGLDAILSTQENSDLNDFKFLEKIEDGNYQNSSVSAKNDQALHIKHEMLRTAGFSSKHIILIIAGAVIFCLCSTLISIIIKKLKIH